MQIKGYVEKIIYSNKDNGYTILSVALSGVERKNITEQDPSVEMELEDEVACVGTLYLINPGEYIVFNGDFNVHPTYGLQFKVTSYEETMPEDIDSVERYLGSGAIKGVGPALAARIVRYFGEDTMRILEEEPDELAKVKGISKRMAMEISDELAEKKDMRRAMIFLGDHGIGMSLAVKIYKQYGERLYAILQENPYRLADDIEGVGFRTADEIARKTGIEANSPFRIQSGILYTLSQAMAVGHTYVPKDLLLEKASGILGVDLVDFDDILGEMAVNRKIMVRDVRDEKAVYLTQLYNTELYVARKLNDLNTKIFLNERKFGIALEAIERKEKIELDALQKDAVREAAANGLVVITGGPGTGKTTIINTIINYFEREGMDILLAAPTGRAAKRMTEATGHEAQTIHRMLELSGVLSEDGKGAVFERNEDNPLETDVVIIDETSMVDIFLMNSLLKAIAVGTRLILVGDANQLPSVGPGNVLNDIIASETFSMVRLTKIFRQESASDIVINAHRINQGEPFEIGPSSREFPFIKRLDSNSIIGAMVTLVREKLPSYTECDINEVQVLTPTRKGNLGVEKLNAVLQQYLNPAVKGKNEKQFGDVVFREGDKVMQIKNNYQLEWEQRGRYGIPTETGMGVFNGDVGIIDNINLFLNELTVRFDDGKYVTYSFREADELEHAYAITVHKSQGSEYPAVVLPLLDGPKMLMNRNILYTAVTRARKCICVVGSDETFHQMVRNVNENKRYSALDLRIREARDNFKGDN